MERKTNLELIQILAAKNKDKQKFFATFHKCLARFSSTVKRGDAICNFIVVQHQAFLVIFPPFLVMLVA